MTLDVQNILVNSEGEISMPELLLLEAPKRKVLHGEVVYNEAPLKPGEACLEVVSDTGTIYRFPATQIKFDFKWMSAEPFYRGKDA